jgi:hypothetical protein
MPKWLPKLLVLCYNISYGILQLRNEIPILLQVCCVDLHSCVDACSCIPWIWYAVGCLKKNLHVLFSTVCFCFFTAVCDHSLPNLHFSLLCSAGALRTKIYNLHVNFLTYLPIINVLNYMLFGSFETFILQLYRFATLCWIIVAALFILIGILLIVSRYCFYFTHCLPYSVMDYV